MVPESMNFDVLRRGYRILLYGGAGVITLDLLFIVLCRLNPTVLFHVWQTILYSFFTNALVFKEEPEIAPSLAQHKRIMQKHSLEKKVSAGFDSSSGMTGHSTSQSPCNRLSRHLFWLAVWFVAYFRHRCVHSDGWWCWNCPSELHSAVTALLQESKLRFTQHMLWWAWCRRKANTIIPSQKLTLSCCQKGHTT